MLDLDRPVFIGGTGRCGTKLIQNCLLKHPEITGPGTETHIFGFTDRVFRKGSWGKTLQLILQLHSRERVNDRLFNIRSRRKYVKLIDKMHEGVEGVLSIKEVSKWMRDRFKFFMEGVAEITKGFRPNAKVFIEKTPHNIKTLDAILMIFPKAKIIVVHRDYRDVVVSFSRNLKTILA